MTNLTDNSMDHSLYLPKQDLMPCQSQQQRTMRHILSHSWLNYNWRTKAATDDLHHHCKMWVKKDDHTFNSKNCMEPKVQSAKTKIWASLYLYYKRFSSLTAIDGHDRQYFNELRSTVVSRRIFIRSRRLIARWTCNDFSSPAVSCNFYKAFLINDMSRGSKSYLFRTS